MISRKILELIFPTCLEFDFTKKIVKTNYRTDFKVESTNDFWNCVTQVAMNLISRKKSWNQVTRLISKLISRKKSWNFLPYFLLIIWFHAKNREIELQDWFQSWFHGKNREIFLLNLLFNLISRKKSWRSFFNVYFTELYNIWEEWREIVMPN